VAVQLAAFADMEKNMTQAANKQTKKLKRKLFIMTLHPKLNRNL